MSSGFQSLMNKAKSLFHRSKHEVIKTTAIGRTMIEESQLENRKRTLLKELGEQTLKLYNDGKLKNKDLEVSCRKLNVLYNRIDAKESAIDEIKATKPTDKN